MLPVRFLPPTLRALSLPPALNQTWAHNCPPDLAPAPAFAIMLSPSAPLNVVQPAEHSLAGQDSAVSHPPNIQDARDLNHASSPPESERQLAIATDMSFGEGEAEEMEDHVTNVNAVRPPTCYPRHPATPHPLVLTLRLLLARLPSSELVGVRRSTAHPTGCQFR